MDGDQRVASIDARWNGSKHKGRGQLRRHVLETVDGELHPSGKQRFFQLLCEHALGSDLAEGDLLQAIAGGLDPFDLDFVAKLT